MSLIGGIEFRPERGLRGSRPLWSKTWAGRAAPSYPSRGGRRPQGSSPLSVIVTCPGGNVVPRPGKFRPWPRGRPHQGVPGRGRAPHDRRADGDVPRVPPGGTYLGHLAGMVLGVHGAVGQRNGDARASSSDPAITPAQKRGERSCSLSPRPSRLLKREQLQVPPLWAQATSSTG